LLEIYGLLVVFFSITNKFQFEKRVFVETQCLRLTEAKPNAQNHLHYIKLNFRSVKVVKKESIRAGYYYQISYEISLKTIKHKAKNDSNKKKNDW
jgi:hypothetical protein